MLVDIVVVVVVVEKTRMALITALLPPFVIPRLLIATTHDRRTADHAGPAEVPMMTMSSSQRLKNL